MIHSKRRWTLLATLGALVSILVAPPSTRAAHQPSTVEGQVIVTLKPATTEVQHAWGPLAGAAPTFLQQAFGEQETFLEPLVLPSQPGPTFLVTSHQTDTASMVDALRHDSRVAQVQPNMQYHALLTPNDPQFSKQWNFVKVNAPQAWDLDQTLPLYGGDPSIVIAVLDTGVAYENFGSFKKLPDFADTHFTAGYDFISSDSHANDDNGHGTHVTGTIAAMTNNGVGAAGIAFQSSIMPIKILDASGGGTTAGIAQGVDYARANGARIINLSLGGSDDDPVLHTAITAAKNAGVIVVAATGNDADGPGYTPSMLYPAAYSEVISVGATRFDNTRATYSNYADGIDLMAPGGDTSVDQNGDGQQDGILQETCSNTGCTSFSPWLYEGTSQAAPHVSAAAALLLAAGAAPGSVQGVLQSTATDIGAAGYDNKTGYGLINIQAALANVVASASIPSGSLTINNGDAATANTDVTLTIAASTALGTVTDMSFSNNGTTFSAWEPYGVVRTHWDLSATSVGGTTTAGVKTVFVRFRNTEGTISSAASDTIVLDQTAPKSVVIHAWSNAKKKRPLQDNQASASTQPIFTVDATDEQSGVAALYVAFGAAAVDPVVSGSIMSGHSYAAPTITTPGTYVLSVRVGDQVGNVSALATFRYVYQLQAVVAVTGSGVRPKVTVFDANGTVIRTFPVFDSRDTGGLSVATGDLDGDGVENIVVGSGPGRAPEIRVYTLTGKLQRRISIRGALLQEGVNVAVGNVRGDRGLEIIAGSVSGTPRIRIFSARGTLLKNFLAFSQTSQGGASIVVGDFAGKGNQEIIVAQAAAATPVVRFFSGTGTMTKQITVPSVSGNIGLTLGKGDIDADGQLDVLAGEVDGSTSRVHVLHRSGKQIGVFRPYPASFKGGVMAVGADVDGDGTDEIFTTPVHRGSQFIKSVTIQGKVEPGIRPIAPSRQTPQGGYRIAPIFLP